MAHILNRRSVIKGMAGMTMLPMVSRVMASEAAAASPNILVVIELKGGNDGLNTVVPLAQYGAYAGLRPNVGLAESALSSTFALTPTGSGSQFAFHPAMSQNLQLGGAPAMGGLPAAYKNGNLAIVVGTGLPDFDTQRDNHACARHDWYVGRPNSWLNGGDGWLGLSLDNNTAIGTLGPTASMNGVAPVLQGRKYTGLVIGSSLSNFNLSYAPGAFIASDYSAWLASPTGAGRAMQLSAALDTETLEDVNYIAGGSSPLSTKVSLANYPFMNPKSISGIEQQLASIAQLILGGSGLLGYFASFGNFDTHDVQATSHPPLLSQLSGAMANFYSFVAANKSTYGVANNVTVMTISDFGRTAHDNTGLGTDHGQAGISFILGDTVNGGVYGDYPSLTKLDNYQLAITVPFQNVISDIVNHIGGNALEIVGENYPKLGFI